MAAVAFSSITPDVGNRDLGFKNALETRKTECVAKIDAIIKIMNMSFLTPSILVQLHEKEITTRLEIGLNQEKITIDLPLLFLAKPEDLNPDTPIGAYLNQWSKAHPKLEDQQQLSAFKKLCEKPVIWEKAKSFLLTHELAHIFHGHIYVNPLNDAESRKDERQADLTAARFSKETASAAYYFNLIDSCKIPNSPSYPTHRERADYLRVQSARDSTSSLRSFTPTAPVARASSSSDTPVRAPSSSTTPTRPACPPSRIPVRIRPTVSPTTPTTLPPSRIPVRKNSFSSSHPPSLQLK